MSIEHGLLRQMDFKDLIQDFASKKSRRVLQGTIKRSRQGVPADRCSFSAGAEIVQPGPIVCRYSEGSAPIQAAPLLKVPHNDRGLQGPHEQRQRRSCEKTAEPVSVSKRLQPSAPAE
ncbi:hypothetical protein AAFF_G00361580 [Aldrovandia affinis]|uniref:Uncharacterized protein n=1 Tax=Aldrovandia affinis TaxID=143900 RepID=A0AAD7SHS8_9TELE|nr:hypothetical protein AAFF_G00361580 [Aldrovandia affinis]